MTESPKVSDLELAILEAVWARGQATVVQVHAALRDSRGLAPTTVATMLRRMEDKGLLTHRTEARRFIYSPTVARDDLRRDLARDLIERVFSGSATELMSHLLDDEDVSAEELERLRGLIDARRRGGGS